MLAKKQCFDLSENHLYQVLNSHLPNKRRTLINLSALLSLI